MRHGSSAFLGATFARGSSMLPLVSRPQNFRARLQMSAQEDPNDVLARARAMEQEKAGQTPTGGEAVQFVDEELPLESPMDQLSPAVEQLLEKEIEQLVLNDQEGTIASPGGALALSGKEKKGNTITDWLLPNIIMPSLAFLLIVCAVVFAADTALVFLAKSSVIQSLGLPPIDLSPACLAKDQRVREIGAALLYVLGGYALSDWLGFAARRRMLFFKMDQTTALLLQRVVKWGSLAVALSVIIRTLGYTTPGLDTVLASSGVAIAFASQTLLKNFIAGLFILLFRPFKAGDLIKVGQIQGMVTNVGVLETTVMAFDGIKVTYANGQIKENYLENLSAHGMRRVEVGVTVSVLADAEATRRALEDAIEPFQHLWERDPRKEELSPRTKKSLGQKLLGTKATQVILRKYRDVVKVLDRNGDGQVSGAELLGALSGDLLSKIAVEVQNKPAVAEGRPGYVICTGGNEIGIQWYAHVWAPSYDYGVTFWAMNEAMLTMLQKRGIKVAARGVLY